MRFAGIVLGCCFGLFTLILGAAAQDVKIYRDISPQKIERIFEELNLAFKKSSGKKEGVHFYDYERNNFKIRLHNYNGKDLWIDALFNEKITPAEVNGWNRKAKFSRAVLLKEGDKETISLESQLDCLGGVTDPIVKQFINRFDNELADFVKYLSK